MIDYFILYLIKANLIIAVLYGFYRLLFHRDTFFQWKRVAMLSIFWAALLIPFINFPLRFLQSNILNHTLSDHPLSFIYLPEVTIFPGQAVHDRLTPSFIFLLIYSIGLGFIIIRIIIQTTQIIRMISQSQPDSQFGKKVYILKGLSTPFSFFQWILLGDQILDNSDLHEIILHEKTHVKQRHSIDVFFTELICAFCWFNPFVWLLKYDIRMNLEYLADQFVVRSGCDPEHYQFHLLRLSYHKAAAKLSNNFNVSPLKKRIQMMNKKKTPWFSLTKYALFLPVTAALLSINNGQALSVSAPETTQNVSAAPPQAKKIYSLSDLSKKPEFPGGDLQLMEFLNKNVPYPAKAASQGKSGKVVVVFTIDSKGKIKDPVIKRSLTPECDQEVIRALSKMPNWIPGEINGKAVSCYYGLPVSFKLQTN